MQILKTIDGTETIISQAAARRLAKSWDARLPRVGQRLIESIPIVEKTIIGRKPRCLYRDGLYRWVVAEWEIVKA